MQTIRLQTAVLFPPQTQRTGCPRDNFQNKRKINYITKRTKEKGLIYPYMVTCAFIESNNIGYITFEIAL